MVTGFTDGALTITKDKLNDCSFKAYYDTNRSGPGMVSFKPFGAVNCSFGTNDKDPISDIYGSAQK